MTARRTAPACAHLPAHLQAVTPADRRRARHAAGLLGGAPGSAVRLLQLRGGIVRRHGAATTGRYTVVFRFSWSQTTGALRTDVPQLELVEVA